ncbi:MAG: M23 family metallopeptidase [Gemmatimonadota bacterium]|nr:M23 family metallopeptidase [Gemmatimonadota bacterium]MDH3477694.1 M23 family metallopeptidase [Gemmatimonadota bacterium]MDH3569902.1 M23 family metallopeptidase [Gemmatimonadota bacterium]
MEHRVWFPTLVVAGLLVTLASSAGTQDSISLSVTWYPGQPVQGSIMHLVVDRPGPVTDRDGNTLPVRGTLAGQPLHFEWDGVRSYRALGAVPVNTRESIPLLLTVADGAGGTADRTIRIPVSPGNFTVEKLRVAPRFAEPPDSALAARIAAERAQAGAVARRSHRTPRLWSGEFTLPVAGRVTSRFGEGREFNDVIQSRHMGTDLNGVIGTPVKAANRGVVALTGDFYYAGNVVYLDHGRGLMTVYMHLSQIHVQRGDTVAAGQVIGDVGATGRVTGPHLHWVARYGPISVDPLSLARAALAAFGPAN